MADFRAGEMVELITGSDPMAVEAVEDKDGTATAVCVWTERADGKQNVKREVFPVVVLKHWQRPVSRAAD